MAQVRAKWLAFYAEHIEPVSKEIFSHVEKLIVGTLIISAGAHVSSNEPAIVLFGYLRHSLVGRGVMLSSEENPLVLPERVLERASGGRPSDHERHHHVREDDYVA